MPKFCDAETANVPDAELAVELDGTTFYHVAPTPPPSVNIAKQGHSLSGFPATFTALRSSGGGWQIVGALSSGIEISLPLLSRAHGRMVPEGTEGVVVFNGPILKIPLAVAVEDDNGTVQNDQLAGYGELFQSLIGHNEDLMETLWQGSQDDEIDQLLAGLINQDDESVRRIISTRLSDEPDAVTGLIIGETAMMFSRQNDGATSQIQITHLSSLT